MDPLTCGDLNPHEPDLVSWQYADQYCRKHNMTLLTVGYKEEELHAGSLQTSYTTHGFRYDMQFIYLGLFTQVRK